MIKVQKINKFFNKNKANEIHVLNNVNIEFPETGLVSLMGPSGCGKTTLLNVLSGLDKGSSGTIQIKGTKFRGYNANKWDNLRITKISYIFQNYVLLNDETVYNNLKIVLDILKVPEAEQKERIMEALKLVKLEKFENRKARQLSGGQQQRVAIARAIVKAPDIIFADEPTGNLDDRNSRLVMDIIKAISKTRLVVLVTHNKDLGLFYSDYIVEMADGKTKEITKNKSEKELSFFHADDIILSKLNKTSFNNPNIEIDYYHEKKEKVKVRLVSEKGNLYIDLKNENIQPILVNEVNSIRILDHEEEKPKENKIEEYNPKPIKAKTHRSAISFWQAFKEALRHIFFPKLGRKFMYFGLIFIGFVSIFAVSSLMGMFYRKADSYKSVADTAYVLESGMSLQEIRDKNRYCNGENFVAPYERNFGLSEKIGSLTTLFGESTSDFLNGSIVPIEKSDYPIGGFAEIIIKKSLIAGDLPLNYNEIVVTQKTLKQYTNRKKQKFNPEEFLGRYINAKYSYGERKLKIVGVSGIDDYYVFVHPLNAIGFHIVNAERFNKPIKPVDDFKDYYYPIKTEAEINALDNSLKTNIKMYQTIINNYADYNKNEYVDDFKENDLGDDRIIIPLAPAMGSGVGYFDYMKQNLNGSEFSVREGKLYLKMAYGKEYQIIGFTNGEKYIVSRRTMVEVYNVITDKVKERIVFYKNAKDFERAFEMTKVKSINKLNKSIADDAEKLSGRYSTLIMPVFLVGFSFLLLVLIMRGSLIDEVYRIGVFRAIGIKKHDCKKLFYVEIFLLTILTSIPGSLVGFIFATNISKLGVMSYETWYLPITIAGIIFVNIIAGMIPISGLLRKTPAQILTKYDI